MKMNMPYSSIDFNLPTIGDHDEDIIVSINEDDLTMFRSGFKPYPDRKLLEVSQVDLTISLEEACRLRDFLNFALPKCENQKSHDIPG